MILCAAQIYTQMRTAKPLHKLTRSSPIDVMEWPHLGGGARERSARGKRNQFRDMNSCCSMVEAAAWVASAIAAKITMRGMRLRLQEGRRDNLMESLELSIRNARIIKASVPHFLTLPARCRQQQQVEQGISGVCSLLKLHRRLYYCAPPQTARRVNERCVAHCTGTIITQRWMHPIQV